MEEEIVQNMIFQLGQSQDRRMPEELKIHFADIDERTPEALLRLAKKFAPVVSFYRNTVSSPAGNWSPFFPGEADVEKGVGSGIGPHPGESPPHLALFLSFLELYKQPQERLNRLTGRHLDFYYREVLRLKKKGAVPDRAHLLLELKKNATAVRVTPQERFSAGKDNTGAELIYAPVRETVIGPAQVASLRALFVDKGGDGTVRYAPIANSSDGIGGSLEGDSPAWSGFGHEVLSEAEVGFALASPLLRMKEGVRKVAVSLALHNIDAARLTEASLASAFDAFLTGEKAWLGPFSLSPTLHENELRFDLTVPENEKGVIDYNPAVHGYAYVTQVPVLQLLLRPGAGVGYRDFDGVTVENGRITVDVSKVTSLNLENDGGTLDPKRAFVPFGPAPTRGSQFRIGYPEALSKKLSQLKLHVQWKDAPSQFSTRYQNYGVSVGNGSFTANVALKTAGDDLHAETVSLFEPGNAAAEHLIPLTLSAPPPSSGSSPTGEVYALSAAGSRWAMIAAKKRVLQKPVFSRFTPVSPVVREGFVTLSLNRDFLHETYRKKYVENVLAYSKLSNPKDPPVILNEPYTPAIQSISLSYTASSDLVNICSTALGDFSNPDLQFFHIAYFGQMREHGYQRAQFSFLTDPRVSLLPSYPYEGELLIGLNGLKAGDSVSLLFQVAEGSADPEREPQEIDWFVLCDNYWKPLGRREVVHDTTGQLLTSGTIRFLIPGEATLVNTILPSGQIWIKAAVAEHAAGMSRLIAVAANAVEVQWVDLGNDPDHLRAPLPPGKIARLKNALSGVKGVKQPYSSFGGRPVETDEAFYTRGSERLRHKNRGITGWDYERIALEAFPAVRQVKCVPHARKGNWLAPGHLLMVVIPDGRNQNAIDPLHPRVSAETIRRMTLYLQERAGMQVKIEVKNPSYQPIQLAFKVRFRSGFDFNFYSGLLNQELVRFLSPWAFDPDRELAFGGKVYQSVLLDFVEDLDYVDYVADFKMSFADGPLQGTDLNEAKPQAPDAILVSAESHIIQEAEEA